MDMCKNEVHNSVDFIGDVYTLDTHQASGKMAEKIIKFYLFLKEMSHQTIHKKCKIRRHLYLENSIIMEKMATGQIENFAH